MLLLSFHIISSAELQLITR
uniref:Uncharacterized protein n=1 Tax=Arundo donax TaxID=35708 RepID=A0A0A9C421_ARUDO